MYLQIAFIHKGESVCETTVCAIAFERLNYWTDKGLIFQPLLTIYQPRIMQAWDDFLTLAVK